jgi:hypothetical protein
MRDARKTARVYMVTSGTWLRRRAAALWPPQASRAVRSAVRQLRAARLDRIMARRRTKQLVIGRIHITNAR